MKKVIVILIVLVGICFAAYYGYVNYLQTTIVTCEDGFRFNPAQGECVSVEFSSGDSRRNVDFSKLILRIPSGTAQVSLTQDEQGMYTGTYSDSETPSLKGFVSIDPKEVKIGENNIAIVPFYLNSGGTGQFIYVALVTVDSNKHIDSVFVGDRTKVKEVEFKNNIVLIDYMTRSASQSFSENPKIPAQLVLSIESDSFVELMRLENATYDDIELRSPKGESTLIGDFLIKGAIPGFWYFEAVAGYRIMDSSLNVIAMGPVQALSDWMTERKVPFEIKLNTGSFGYKGNATIIIESENVQGGEEGEILVKRMSIPVVIK